MNQLKDNWDTIKESIKKEYEITDISYNTWIAPLKFYKVENNTVIIIIPSDQSHALTYISNKYSSYFKVMITEMMDHEYDVSFILEKNIEEDNELSTKKDSSAYHINYENANLNPKYTFDTFVVGSNNKFAHSAALAVAETPGITYNPLYLYGGAGLGKTHLMHSIGHFILEQNPNKKVLYVTSEQFTNEVIESIRGGNAAAMTNLRDKYRTVDVLLIDDIQFIIGKESTQEEFFNTFNVLHGSNKQLVLSSDKPPKDMETLEERLRSRFEMGLIADIQAPDYETRVAILLKKAETTGKVINDQILNYIAENISSNIRELEGAFNKIIAYSRLNKIDLSDMTLNDAEEALKDIIYPDKPVEVTPALVINTVAEHFNINPEDITSKKRNGDLITPRNIVMYICREKIGMTLQATANVLKKKDHTTIMSGCKKIKNDILNKKDIEENVDKIIKKLNL